MCQTTQYFQFICNRDQFASSVIYFGQVKFEFLGKYQELQNFFLHNSDSNLYTGLFNKEKACIICDNFFMLSASSKVCHPFHEEK